MSADCLYFENSLGKLEDELTPNFDSNFLIVADFYEFIAKIFVVL